MQQRMKNESSSNGEERSVAPRIPIPLYAERHYSVAEISEMWNLSPDVVRKLFQNEPGVLTLADQVARHKRRYTTLRIPESIVQHVHRKLSNCLTIKEL